MSASSPTMDAECEALIYVSSWRYVFGSFYFGSLKILSFAKRHTVTPWLNQHARVIFLINMLTAQLVGVYQSIFGEPVGYVRLKSIRLVGNCGLSRYRQIVQHKRDCAVAQINVPYVV